MEKIRNFSTKQKILKPQRAQKENRDKKVTFNVLIPWLKGSKSPQALMEKQNLQSWRLFFGNVFPWLTSCVQASHQQVWCQAPNPNEQLDWTMVQWKCVLLSDGSHYYWLHCGNCEVWWKTVNRRIIFPGLWPGSDFQKKASLNASANSAMFVESSFYFWNDKEVLWIIVEPIEHERVVNLQKNLKQIVIYT